jgi:alanine racemase
MDSVLIDVTGLKVRAGDRAILISAEGEQRVSAEHLARWAGTIKYEITTSLLPRARRRL